MLIDAPRASVYLRSTLDDHDDFTDDTNDFTCEQVQLDAR